MVTLDSEKLKAVQMCALSYLSGPKNKWYEDCFTELHMLTLQERRPRGDMIETWKILHRKLNIEPGTWFKMVTDSSQLTRQSAGYLNVLKSMFNLDIMKKLVQS